MLYSLASCNNLVIWKDISEVDTKCHRKVHHHPPGQHPRQPCHLRWGPELPLTTLSTPVLSSLVQESVLLQVLQLLGLPSLRTSKSSLSNHRRQSLNVRSVVRCLGTQFSSQSADTAVARLVYQNCSGELVWRCTWSTQVCKVYRFDVLCTCTGNRYNCAGVMCT